MRRKKIKGQMSAKDAEALARKKRRQADFSAAKKGDAAAARRVIRRGPFGGTS